MQNTSGGKRVRSKSLSQYHTEDIYPRSTISNCSFINILIEHHSKCPKSHISQFEATSRKDTSNCPEKSEENKSFQPHDFSAFYLCYDRTLLLFSRPIIDKDTSALIPHDCDPHLNQTKFNRLLPLTIAGVLVKGNKSFGMVWLILVLKLESSSMCCYLALVERLLTKRINCVRLI